MDAQHLLLGWMVVFWGNGVVVVWGLFYDLIFKCKYAGLTDLGVQELRINWVISIQNNKKKKKNSKINMLAKSFVEIVKF
jgi:hypothetical protein